MAKAFGWTSSSTSTSGGQGGGSSTRGSSKSTTYSDSTTEDIVQRHLAFPDELMVLRDNKQLVLIENSNPIPCKKVPWYENEKLKGLGVNLRSQESEALPAPEGEPQTGIRGHARPPEQKKDTRNESIKHLGARRRPKSHQ